ncbi:MAG: hypothetical protein OK422_01175 [Thaumarchaeota archaeon]|nr:hypothetical protein [Nitrososphaerota archaeon]
MRGESSAGSRHPYLSSDDSLLLRQAIGGFRGTTCLEIGFGNGGNLHSLAGGFSLAVGTDLEAARPRPGEKNLEVVRADSATCFRESVFDLVAFNPPYVPSVGIEDLAVDGGRGGVEVPLTFLREALRVVKKGGKIVMLLSSLNDTDVIKEFCTAERVTMRKIARRRLFYETLSVYVCAPESTSADDLQKLAR